MERFSTFNSFDTSRIVKVSSRLVQPLAVIGGLWTVYQLTSLTWWTWLHFFRRSTIAKYKDDDRETWALVTGASYGIGKGFAYELASRGFEVVLHGRNEAKLNDVKSELQRQYPNRKVRIAVLDADTFELDQVASMVDEIKGLNIRILVNNVAGGGKYEKPIFASLQDKKPESVDAWINITARFPTHLTRLLLPTLINKKSSLILNIGSGASEMSTPYLGIYSGLKAYNKVWSNCLQVELKAEGNSHVEVIAIIVGQVATERMKNRVVGATIPTSRQMAKSSLEAAGCGRKDIAAYWGHAIQNGILTLLPQFVFDHYGSAAVRKLKAEEAEEIEKE